MYTLRTLECPSGWVNGGNLGCYFVAKESSIMTHNSAKDYCKSLDERAQLVEIYTLRMQKFVEGLKDIKSSGNWWMGGTDELEVSSKMCLKTLKSWLHKPSMHLNETRKVSMSLYKSQ